MGRGLAQGDELRVRDRRGRGGRRHRAGRSRVHRSSESENSLVKTTVSGYSRIGTYMTDSRSAGASRCSASEGSTISGVHDKARMTPRCNATCGGLSPTFQRSPHVTKTTRCQLRSVFKWSAAARKATWLAAGATAPPRKVGASSLVACLPGHVAYLGNSWDLSRQERIRKSGLALPRHQLGINWCCLLPSLATSGQHLRPVHASCLIAHALMPSLATARQDRFRHSSSLVASGPDDEAGPLDDSIGDWQLWRVLQRSHLVNGVIQSC